SRAARDLLHGDDVLEIAEARAPVFLLDRNAVQTERAHARPELTWESVGPVDLGGNGRDLVGRERTDRVAKLVGCLAEIEIERRVLIGKRHGGPRDGLQPQGCAARLDCRYPGARASASRALPVSAS